MIELEYPLIIRTTEEPDFFGFYSENLEGFSGIGHSIADCIYKATWGMKDHISLLKEKGLPIPPKSKNPNWGIHFTKVSIERKHANMLILLHS